MVLITRFFADLMKMKAALEGKVCYMTTWRKIIAAVRPVITFDAAHLKIIHKGGLCTFGVLNANDDIFILSFGVATGNESKDNWKYY